MENMTMKKTLSLIMISMMIVNSILYITPEELNYNQAGPNDQENNPNTVISSFIQDD